MLALDPSQWTLLTFIVAIGAAGLRQLWVWGWTYAEVKKDRDFWRNTALKALGHTDKALDIASGGKVKGDG